MGTFDLAQLPGQGIKVRADIRGLMSGNTYMICINMYGNTSGNCANIGKEYNNLREYDYYGNANPHQDPLRGRAGPMVADQQGEYYGILDLQQNLAGERSIIGRSIGFMNTKDNSFAGCCTIGREKNPNDPVEYDNWTFLGGSVQGNGAHSHQ